MGGGNEAALLSRDDSLSVNKEASQCVNLCNSNSEHDEQIQARPEGHSPQVVLQEVAVSSLKGPQHSLGLPAPLQVPVHRIHSSLEEEDHNITCSHGITYVQIHIQRRLFRKLRSSST